MSVVARFVTGLTMGLMMDFVLGRHLAVLGWLYGNVDHSQPTVLVWVALTALTHC